MARRKLLVPVLAMCLVFAGCTAAPRPEALVAANGTTTTVANGSTEAAGQPGADTSTASTAPGTAQGGGPGSRSNGTGSAGPGGTKPGAGPNRTTPKRPTLSGLFTPDEDRVGITDTSITLCAHAALTYGAAFHTSQSDLNVYWNSINAAGGVYGRQVNVQYVNDNYTSDQAIQAATTCRDSYHPFAILGGIGFDQIPGVRDWAEKNRQLYIHHTATENGANNLQFSYTALPTTERTGQVFGHLAATKFRGKKIGILKRDSINWEPGINGFKQVAAARGVQIVLERAVPQNKGNYLQDILDLKGAGADVVFIWLNALETAQVIPQIKGQGWNPNIMVFPFNLVSQTVKDQALNPPITGVGMFQAYSYGDRSGEFAKYADDMDQFEQQYAKIDPSADLKGLGGDLLFLNWSAQKAFHKMLLACGPDCGRNELLKLFSTYKARPTSSACTIDFTRPGPGNSHRGGYALSVMEAYKTADGNYNFRNTNTCVETL